MSAVATPSPASGRPDPSSSPPSSSSPSSSSSAPGSTNAEQTPHSVAQVEEDDEEDEWDARIRRTGCFPQHEALQDCYYEKKDWRRCRDEMAAFRECFRRQQDLQRRDPSYRPS